ncbi:MAG: hypothetical protein H6633_15425 [Anaerolineales bacterium]|nr:hypothetical protein [Anaerolineales bacterium]
MSGTVTMQFEERDQSAGRGGALVPPGVVHTFSNQEDVPSTFCRAFLSPGGFEDSLRPWGKPCRQETTWLEADMSKPAALNTKYGICIPSARSGRCP